jgi:two-component system, cell cycle response regulator DivK
MSDSLVLVVDDNPTNTKLIRLLLADEGFEVRSAANAEEALASLEERVPQLILMDIQLPGTDGLTLTRNLRSQRRFDHVWILALSAYAMASDEVKARQAGCDGYITKPIDTRTLPDVLRKLMVSPRPEPVLEP